MVKFMACFKAIIFKNRVKRAFKVEGVINSNGKGTANEISLYLDLVNAKDGSNFRLGVSKP